MTVVTDWHQFIQHTGKVHKVIEPPQGMNCRVFRLRAERGDFMVKTGASLESIAELQREADILQFLASNVPEASGVVPHFVAHDGVYFLLTGLPGENLAVYSADSANAAVRADLVYQFGQLLQNIHGWTPLHMPVPRNWTQTALQKCAARLESESLGESLHYPFSQFHGAKTSHLLQMVREAAPAATDQIAWGHGDWCVPNALVCNRKVIYAVDWGGGGYADRRYDLAAAVRSLRRNDLGMFVPDFLCGYKWQGTIESLALFELMYVIL